MLNSKRAMLARALFCALTCAVSSLYAQPATAPPASEPEEEPVAAANLLADEQSQLADKYRRLEDLIFKMADFEATSNPRRAALLKQAYKQSKDRLTYSQLSSIVILLSDKSYKRAVDGQEGARKDLQDLLQLLLSEDRSDRLKTETQKIKDFLKELKRLEKMQRSVRGRTEGGSDAEELAKNQGKLADRTGDLAKELEEADAQSQADGKGGEQSEGQGEPSGKPSEGEQKPSDAKPDDGSQKGDAGDPSDEQGKKPDADKDGEAKKDDSSKKDTEAKPPQDAPGSEGKPQGDQDSQQPQPGDSQQPKPGDQQGKPGQQQQQPGEGDPGRQDSQQPPPPEEEPAKKRVREAEQKMREAQQKLEEAKRSESVEKQTEALEKLQQAIADLEEVLRQLREEELERVLALLEGRFRQMLEAELKVYEGTLRIDKIPADQRGRAIDIRANKLAFDQRKIAGQADRCLTLLLEEGSSVAFPEVVEQMRDDMEEVSARLSDVKVARITQGLEEEIIGTLEELIEALQKAQQELDNSKNSPPGQPGSGDDAPLVDILAELKMIRSLQVRVNSRTNRYARLLEITDDPVGQAITDDLRQAIGKLGEREASIHQITRDIVLGKNK